MQANYVILTLKNVMMALNTVQCSGESNLDAVSSSIKVLRKLTEQFENEVLEAKKEAEKSNDTGT